MLEAFVHWFRSWKPARSDGVLPKERGVGTWNLADEFVEAADELKPVLGTLSQFPIYLLYGHGIELALKAFLICQGVTEKKLRDIGHDLKKALRTARAHDSFQFPPDYDLQIIDLLNLYYKGKEFEYLVPGMKNLPQLDELGEVAHRLLAAMKPIIWKAVRMHLGPAKAATLPEPPVE
jgi:hypothetical protein